MTGNERWQRLEALFQQALDLEPRARSAFLAGRCAGAPELRCEVEELLAADEAVKATWPGMTLGFSKASPPPEGLRIPHYKIVGLLGQGGMGTVYLALRYDELFSGKPFAVKVLRLGRAQRGRARRFAAERRILSRLDHPYIARLYDGGQLPDTTPYLVMDYVDGRTLERYCRENRLSIDDRLRLFRKVCAAVHYAHQNLVVHRDIKPGNILVSDDGTPRLLDFGIAKLLDPDEVGADSEASDDPPAGRQQPMTPDYASPEQIRGAVVTTASDLYSLGVVLFELLTSRLPGSVRPGSSPPRPSTVVLGDAAADVAHPCRLTPARLRHRLQGDLDDVVMKALEADPEQRYASAQQLAEDLRCHLEDLPVAASGGHWRYRLGKFVRRRRLQVVLAASLLAAATFIPTAFVQSRRLERTVGVLRQLAGPQADPVMSEDFLDGVVADIVAFDGPPRTKALLMEVVRRLYVPDEILFKDVLEAFEDDQVSAEQVLEIADLSLSVGRLLLNKGQLEQAESTLRVSVLRAEEIRPGDDETLALHWDSLAMVLNSLGRYEEATQLLERSLGLRQRVLGPGHVDVASSLHQLGQVASARGAYGASADFFRRSLEIRQADASTDPLILAGLLTSLSLALMEQGSFQEAEQLARRALEIRRRQLGKKHQYVAQALSNLFTIICRKGDIEACIPVGLETVELAEEVLGPDHFRLAHPLLGLGAAYARVGEAALCERYSRRAMALREAHLPESHWLVALARSTLGGCLSDLGRYDEAEVLLAESWRVLEAQRGAQDHWTRLTRERLDRLERRHEDGPGR